MVKFYKTTSMDLVDEMMRKFELLEIEKRDKYQIPHETITIEKFVEMVKSFLPSFASFEEIENNNILSQKVKYRIEHVLAKADCEMFFISVLDSSSFDADDINNPSASYHLRKLIWLEQNGMHIIDDSRIRLMHVDLMLDLLLNPTTHRFAKGTLKSNKSAINVLTL